MGNNNNNVYDIKLLMGDLCSRRALAKPLDRAALLLGRLAHLPALQVWRQHNWAVLHAQQARNSAADRRKRAAHFARAAFGERQLPPLRKKPNEVTSNKTSIRVAF